MRIIDQSMLLGIIQDMRVTIRATIAVPPIPVTPTEVENKKMKQNLEVEHVRYHTFSVVFVVTSSFFWLADSRYASSGAGWNAASPYHGSNHSRHESRRPAPPKQQSAYYII